MNSSIRQFNPGLIIIALTATIATVAQPQPASAQILEVVSGALNALVRSKQPQPQVIQQPVPVPTPVTPGRPEFNVGTNNANGNSLNLCLSNCLPAGSAPAPAPVLAPQPIVTQIPQVVPQSPIAQQQTSSTVVNHNGVVNGTATAQTDQQSSSQSATVQNIPNYPTTNISPVNLPINLPR
ncbi:MAG TPA: hypothetical protein V6C71_02360 [Coleofasciculaceae cyanobacterium]|jgi:hypothetical protein